MEKGAPQPAANFPPIAAHPPLLKPQRLEASTDQKGGGLGVVFQAEGKGLREINEKKKKKKKLVDSTPPPPPVCFFGVSPPPDPGPMRTSPPSRVKQLLVKNGYVCGAGGGNGNLEKSFAPPPGKGERKGLGGNKWEI